MEPFYLKSYGRSAEPGDGIVGGVLQRDYPNAVDGGKTL